MEKCLIFQQIVFQILLVSKMEN